MTEYELRSVASKYPGWLLGLLKAVKKQHPHLRPSKLPPKTFDALVGTAESFQAQLTSPRPAGDAAPPVPLRPYPDPRLAHPTPKNHPYPSPFAMPQPMQQPMFNPAQISPLANPLGSPGFGFGGGPVMQPGWPPFNTFNQMQPRFYTVEQVPPYPRIMSETATLHVHNRLGPTILANLIASRVNVEIRVRNLFQQWALRPKSFSPHAFAECVNLVRGIHLQILEAKSAQVALRSSLRLEMDRRRLHALLEVERAVCCEGITRSQAWSSNRHILEHQADGSIGDNAVSRIVQRDFLQHAKFEASIRKKVSTSDDSDAEKPKSKK